jgi:putative ABC transport system permease protein
VVLERSFAAYHDLPSTGSLRVGGGEQLRWVGLGQSPEYFILTGEEGTGFFTQSTYAVLFSSLATAQAAARAPGRVNDLVLTLADGADRAAVRRDLERSLGEGSEPVSATVTSRDEMPAHRLLYRDIDNDQKVWNVIAGLMLVSAAFASFNLTGRVVEAQRREIGVGMALGVPRAALAVRPLLLGVQIALLGALLGVGAGLAVGAALADQFRTLLPLPVWQTDFQVGAFARAAALGFTLPLLAVVWPVWRAVRVEPVEAIRVGHLAGRARAQGWAPGTRKARR